MSPILEKFLDSGRDCPYHGRLNDLPRGTRMNTDQSRIEDLIARLSETLTVEVKRWISIDEPNGISTIIRGALALRNRNGGYFVIGFDDKILLLRRRDVRFGRTFACGGRRPGIDVAPGFGFGHQPVTFSCSPDDLRHARAGRPNGGIKAWHLAKRVTSPSTISRWRQTWRVKSANSCAATS